jgi:hypothetical protein
MYRLQRVSPALLITLFVLALYTGVLTINTAKARALWHSLGGRYGILAP